MLYDSQLFQLLFFSRLKSYVVYTINGTMSMTVGNVPSFFYIGPHYRCIIGLYLLPTATMSVGVGKMFESVDLFVCLFVYLFI